MIRPRGEFEATRSAMHALSTHVWECDHLLNEDGLPYSTASINESALTRAEAESRMIALMAGLRMSGVAFDLMQFDDGTWYVAARAYGEPPVPIHFHVLSEAERVERQGEEG